MTKNRLTSRQAYWLFYALAWMSVAVPAMLMYIHLRGNACVAEAALNAFIVTLPYFFLTGKWRWTTLVPVWGVAFFYLSNTWYWRFFNDFIPLSNYFLWNNVGNEVIDTTLMLAKPKDIVFLVMPVVTTAAYFGLFRMPVRAYHVPKGWRLASPFVGLAMFVSCYTTELRNGGFTKPQVSPWVEYNIHGLVGYFVKNASLSLGRAMQSREASDEDLKLIRQYRDSRLALTTNDSMAVLGGG